VTGAMKPDVVGLMRLVVITEPGGFGRGHEEIARAALAGGCKAVQMRDKMLSDIDFEGTAGRLKKLCHRSQALFFVNDRVRIAAAVQSDGVHLGVQDIDVETARKAMPSGSLIGFSPENMEQARQAVAAGADYLGVGPVFATATKGDAGAPIGLDGLAAYAQAGIAPVIAVGGIDMDNAASALEAGAAGVAVVSVVSGAADMEATVRELVKRLGLDTLI
jgi:thiamine-phosphate pyrophosphorylase